MSISLLGCKPLTVSRRARRMPLRPSTRDQRRPEGSQNKAKLTRDRLRGQARFATGLRLIRAPVLVNHILSGPDPEQGESSSWRLPDLYWFIEARFAKTMCSPSMSWAVRRLGLSKQGCIGIHRSPHPARRRLDHDRPCFFSTCSMPSATMASIEFPGLPFSFTRSRDSARIRETRSRSSHTVKACRLAR